MIISTPHASEPILRSVTAHISHYQRSVRVGSPVDLGRELSFKTRAGCYDALSHDRRINDTITTFSAQLLRTQQSVYGSHVKT